MDVRTNKKISKLVAATLAFGGIWGIHGMAEMSSTQTLTPDGTSNSIIVITSDGTTITKQDGSTINVEKGTTIIWSVVK